MPPRNRGETLLFVDAETETLVGFGTWRHRDVILPWGTERAIGIEWVGVDVSYQHQRTDEGSSIVERIIITLEARAGDHELSTPDMPLFLEVDAENQHAQDVWEHLGFRFLEPVEVLHRGRYRRMLRSPSV
jgi:ribosomal protein S18 acetylase RimI-like enzyme